MTRRLPERMLLGSVAVPDIVLAHRVSNPDRVTGGVRGPLQLRWPSRDGPPRRRIPAAIFPTPVRGRRLVSHPE